jgi:hypothetical protein
MHEGEVTHQIAEYVRFVEGWNERVHNNDAADPGEFDQYANLVKSGFWATRDELLFAGGEISWRTDTSGSGESRRFKD